MLKNIAVFIFALICIMGLAVSPASAFPRNLEWRTVETEHFRISYHQGLEKVGRHLANLAEQIYDELTPLLSWTPNYKTEMAIVDHVDSPNGYTNVYPYNWIVLFAVPPDTKSTLNDYNDWLKILVGHEFTHILQLDTKSGLPAALNMIFGGMLHPNQYMPRWYTEGIAVFEESRITSGGRQRSSIFEMFLRMDVVENRFLSIDQIGGSPERWPHGHIPYLYGAKFIQYLADKYGEKTLSALGYLYGQRLIPYALNAVLQKVVKDDYVRLYDEWREMLTARLKEDVNRLSALGLTPLDYLTDGGETHDSPRLFPTGDRVLYFHDDDLPGRTGWAEMNLADGRSKIILEAESDGGADISPDGRRIIYAQTTYTDNEYYQHDLYLYEAIPNQSRRLTNHLRAREPSFAPDGRNVVFVRYGPGSSSLSTLDLDTLNVLELLPEGSFDQVFSPVWSPDGARIAFIGWTLGGHKDLYLYEIESKRVLRVTDDTALDTTPSFSPDGRTLYWSSDRTGIYNIYALSIPDLRMTQVTNVVGGVFSPCVTPDGATLLVSSYRSKGFDLARIDLRGVTARVEPSIPDLRPDAYHPPSPVEATDQPYSPFPSLFPKVWFPTWGDDHEGMTLGVHTWGNDIVGDHSWDLEADMGVYSGDPSVAFRYRYNGGYPAFSIGATHSSYTLNNAGYKEETRIDQDESRTSGSLSIAFPFRGREVRGRTSHVYAHSLGLSAHFSYTRLLNRYTYEPTEEAPQFVDTGLESGFGISWYYQKRRYYSGFVSTAEGRAFSVSLRGSTDLIGSEYNTLVVSGGYSEYIPNPWLDRHTLALHLSGGIGAADYARRLVFAIGGEPKQNIVSNLIRENRTYGDFVRGYKPLSLYGNKYVVFKSEYRFVVWTIDRGVSTLPIFFSNLNVAPFFDMGYAWSDTLTLSGIKKGVGGELRLDFLYGYFTPTTLRVGYQVGLDKGGIHSFFFALDNLF